MSEHFAVEMRHCDGCGEDYNAFEESHVGHALTARPPLPPTDAAAYQWPDIDIAGEENEARAREWWA